ncbi:MAG: SDR family oxidoreductase [Bryobacteraceae bacterium]|nr:SDR family oxidoreductase [Bryobacteraceae bacterium]
MDKPLEGRIAFVTGSGRGLGRAIAARLAELGADVAIHDINREAPAKYGEASDIDQVAAAIARSGGPTAAVAGNIGDRDTVFGMASFIADRLGPVDVLVNCAGGDIGASGGKPSPNNALDISFEDIQTLVNNNLIGTMLVCQAFCKPMVERRRGCVINIASGAAHFGTSPEVVYSTLKAAVAHYTRCLAFELRPYGVRVNAVSPGPTKTARFLATRKVDPEMMQHEASLNRYGEPEEIADVVAFLAGDGARFIHGQILRVDGGMTLYAG